MFRNENIDDEILDECQKYIIFVNIFLDINNPKDCYFIHYPFSGSLMEQPAITMSILRVIKNEWIAYLREEQEKENRKHRR